MKRLITVSAALALVIGCNKGPEVQAAPRNDLAAPATAPASAPADKPVSTASGAPATTGTAAANPVKKTLGGNNYREVTLPAGTVLAVDLETPVGSDISRPEQRVQGRLRRAVTSRGVDVLPVGTALSGHVTSAQRPGRVKGRGLVAFRFTQLDTPGAGTSRISTATISRMAPATKQKDTLEIVGPAAAGAVIGRIAGGKGAARKGAVIGGAAGTGYVLSTRGKEVRLARGTDLAVRLTGPLSLRVPVAR
ncbi:MAG TPA: hypothetical protein VEL51_02795 [Vicinamibacterales bacterium]|nr:hypothetical protein [Vicinamibacterales bacterium]